MFRTRYINPLPFGDTLNADGEERIGYDSAERDEESRFIDGRPAIQPTD